MIPYGLSLKAFSLQPSAYLIGSRLVKRPAGAGHFLDQAGGFEMRSVLFFEFGELALNVLQPH